MKEKDKLPDENDCLITDRMPKQSAENGGYIGGLKKDRSSPTAYGYNVNQDGSTVVEIPDGLLSVKEVTFAIGLNEPSEDKNVVAAPGSWASSASDLPSFPSSGISTPANPVDGAAGQPVDPWALPDILEAHANAKTWNDMTNGERIRQILGYIIKGVLLLFLLYFFICSLGLLTDGFRLLGGRAAGEVFQDSKMLRNPIAGLMIGVLATVLLQSSSTTTSIIVGMVAAEILNVRMAIPLVMGANIGTSMTNTIVSVAHSGRRNEFRRAFAGATVHDMFNWMCVIVLLPCEIITGYLYHVTGWIIKGLHISGDHKKPPKLLKHLTEPVTKMIVQLDKNKIHDIAMGKIENYDSHFTLIKHDCSKTNGTIKPCKHFFVNTTIPDSTVGVILLIIALAVLVACLVLIVKLLSSLLKGQVARAIRKTINNDLPSPFGFLTGYMHMAIGVVMTILVQSSSVFTSALTPLVGIGVLTLERMYPLTLGANVGTTFTSLLAALASPPSRLESSLQISLCHLFFNLTGIFLFYTLPCLRPLPVFMAKTLGNKTAKYRWFALVYIVLMFFVAPAVCFGLSMAGPDVMTAVGIPCALLVALLFLVNVLQRRFPGLLPSFLRSWEFLPKWMHSLAPIDGVMTRAGYALRSLFPCCGSRFPFCCCASAPEAGEPGTPTNLAKLRADSRRGLMLTAQSTPAPSISCGLHRAGVDGTTTSRSLSPICQPPPAIASTDDEGMVTIV